MTHYVIVENACRNLVLSKKIGEARELRSIAQKYLTPYGLTRTYVLVSYFFMVPGKLPTSTYLPMYLLGSPGFCLYDGMDSGETIMTVKTNGVGLGSHNWPSGVHAIIQAKSRTNN